MSIGKATRARSVAYRADHSLLAMHSETRGGQREDTLARPPIRDICPLSDSEIRDLVNAYYSVCEWVPIYFLWRPNLADEGDNFLVELALAGNAEVIVTNNVRDLRTAKLKFPGAAVQGSQDLLRGNT